MWYLIGPSSRTSRQWMDMQADIPPKTSAGEYLKIECYGVDGSKIDKRTYYGRITNQASIIVQYKDIKPNSNKYSQGLTPARIGHTIKQH